MSQMTFAQLCAEFQSTISEISRLMCLPEQYQRPNHQQRLDLLMKQKQQLKAEMQRRIEEGK